VSDNPYTAPEYPPHDPQEHAEYLDLPDSIRNWAMLCHLSALLAMPFGFGHLVGPLIVWLLKRDDHPFIDDQGKESLNFQISMTIYAVVAAVLICALVGIALVPVVFVANIVFIVIASVRSSRGEWYRYPLTIRLIR